jgi:hypothetical protein
MDPMSELREAVLRAIERKSAGIAAQRGFDLPLQVGAALNTLGGSAEQGFDATLGPGYDSGTGETTVPFTWGLSLWGGADLWTGS